MAVEVACVLVTPHSLARARTGGILSSLLSRSGCELVAARIFAPGDELTRAFADRFACDSATADPSVLTRLQNYVLTRLGPDLKSACRRRVLLFLFKGEDAVRRVRAVAGPLLPSAPNAATLRGTFGEFSADADGELAHFEPAVFVASHAAESLSWLRLWTRYSVTDGGLVAGTASSAPGLTPERTLVLIKPDILHAGGVRPGGVLDLFDGTGLSLIGARLVRLSTAQALEFYGPVREALRTRLTGVVGAEARRSLATNPELGFALPAEIEGRLGELLGPLYGDFRFDNLVRFMSGRAAAECPPAELDRPGTEPCLGLVYEGADAVRKCREVLGPTEPATAPRGTVRREFGTSMLLNAAHASDSADNARREIAILRPELDDLGRELAAVAGAMEPVLPDSGH